MSGRRIGYLSSLIYYFGYFSNNFSALGAAERAAKNSITGCELFAHRRGVGI